MFYITVDIRKLFVYPGNVSQQQIFFCYDILSRSSRNSPGFDPSINRHGGMLGGRAVVEEPNIFFSIADPGSGFFHPGSGFFHPYFGFYPESATPSFLYPSVKALKYYGIPESLVSSNRTAIYKNF
jgi:hypothetical protein